MGFLQRTITPRTTLFFLMSLPGITREAVLHVAAKAGGGVGPDVSRRSTAEEPPVTFQRCGVPVVELRLFGGPSLSRSVMQRRFQHIGAEPQPVRPRIRQVQVPRLIDLIGRRDRMPRRHSAAHHFSERITPCADRPRAAPAARPPGPAADSTSHRSRPRSRPAAGAVGTRSRNEQGVAGSAACSDAAERVSGECVWVPVEPLT